VHSVSWAEEFGIISLQTINGRLLVDGHLISAYEIHSWWGAFDAAPQRWLFQIFGASVAESYAIILYTRFTDSIMEPIVIALRDAWQSYGTGTGMLGQAIINHS
jgi:hypothetical protein